MKNKLGTILLVLVLMFSFMLNVNAETIKEDTSTYDGDVYIIGSSKFDSNIIVTGTMASVAGAREAYVQYIVNQNLKFKPEDVKIYYYSELDETWSILPETSGEELKELTEEEVKEFTEDLNIYFVNEVEKTIEVPYETLVEDGYELKFKTNDESHNDKVKYENGKLILPATVKRVDVYAVPEEVEEGEEPEEVRLGVVEQNEGVFENTSSIVRTYEELLFALGSDAETIRIEENIDLPTALEITRKVEIYLNGADLTVTEDTAGDGVFLVTAGGHLTIDGDGTINGVGNNVYNIAIWANGGEVVINGGTYTNVGAGTDDHYDLIYAKNGGKVTINGGRFIAHTPKWTLNLKDSDGSEILVKGGEFVGYNPSEVYTEPTQPLNFVAEGYKVTFENGYFVVSELTDNDVAVVNGLTYTSLSDAIANTGDDLAIKLIKDIDLETAEEVSKKVVLDLNGHNVTVTEDTAGDGVFLVTAGGHLTINGEGVINGVGDNVYNIAIWANGGEVVINGGTYTNVGAGEDDHYDLIYAKNGGKVTINGGRFIAHTPKWTLNLKDSDGSRIMVKGGTFVNYNPAEVYTEPTQPLNFVAEGYKVTMVDGEYVVSKLTSEDVAVVNGLTYTSLEDAVSNAGDSTIKLIKDIDFETAFVVDRKIVLDLNGHNLTVKEDTAGDGVFHVVEGGDLTINGEGIVDGCGKNKWNLVIFAEAGKVTLNGGTYSNKNLVVMPEDADSDHYDVIYAKHTAEIVINGGRFEGKTPAWLLNQHDATRNTSSIVVRGGEFVGFNPANNAAEGNNTNFVADGYKVVEAEGVYTVVKAADDEVATISGVAYKSLKAAITAVTEGEVVRLIKDIDLPTAEEVSKKVVLDLNGHNVTVTEDTAGDGVFLVTAGGHLTINGEGVINGVGDNVYNIAIWANGGEVVINGGTYTNVGAGEDDHYDLIYAKNGGKVTINGGRFIAHTPKWTLNLKDSDGSEILVKGGEFVGYNPAEVYTEPTQPLNFVAEGYKSEPLSEGNYTVVKVSE